ncbi:MAG: hypothetical protein U0936_12300 [Planctomycetaceae bacterium]
MPARITSLFALAVLVTMGARAVAQDAGTNLGAENEIDTSIQATLAEQLQGTVDRLVEELSSPLFKPRQNAIAEILKLEAPAVGMLEAKMKVVPERVAIQLRQAIPQLRKRLFDDRIQALENQQDQATPTGMPDWDRFVRLTGDADEALPVYLEMLRAERALFATRMFSSSELSEQLEESSQRLREACTGELEEEFPVASAAALMLIASDEGVVLRRATSTNISESLQDSRFGKLVNDGVHAKTLKAVTSEWLRRPGIAVDRPLLLSMEYHLPVGREIAMRTLERPVYSQSAAYSLLCLGSLRTADALPEVERVLRDAAAARPIWPPRGTNVEDLATAREVKSTYSVQVRDVALAVAIHLRGKRPQDFGVDVMSSEKQLFTLDSMGFNNDEERDAAIARYRTSYPEDIVPK